MYLAPSESEEEKEEGSASGDRRRLQEAKAVDEKGAKEVEKMEEISCFRRKLEKIKLMEPTATSFFENSEDHHPRNAVDGNKDTNFALQGGKVDGYWQALLPIP